MLWTKISSMQSWRPKKAERSHQLLTYMTMKNCYLHSRHFICSLARNQFRVIVGIHRTAQRDNKKVLRRSIFSFIFWHQTVLEEPTTNCNLAAGHTHPLYSPYRWY